MEGASIRLKPLIKTVYEKRYKWKVVKIFKHVKKETISVYDYIMWKHMSWNSLKVLILLFENLKEG